MNFQLVLNNSLYNCSEDFIIDNLHETLNQCTEQLEQSGTCILNPLYSNKMYKRFLFWRVGYVFGESHLNNIIDKTNAIGVEALNFIEAASSLVQIGKQLLDQPSFSSSFCKLYSKTILIFNAAYPLAQKDELKNLSACIFSKNCKTVFTPLYETEDVFRHIVSFINIREHPLLLVSQDVNKIAWSILIEKNEKKEDEKLESNVFSILSYILSPHLMEERYVIDREIVFLLNIDKHGEIINLFPFTESKEELKQFMHSSCTMFKIAFPVDFLAAAMINSKKSFPFTVVEMENDMNILSSEAKTMMDKLVSNFNDVVRKIDQPTFEKLCKNWKGKRTKRRYI